jgi:cold-inducible RNA-binding protein
MTNKLFVAGISYRSTDEDLKNYFEQAGTVLEANIAIERETGRSRGFGFVTMATPEEAQNAIEKLHDTEMDGRIIAVRISEDKPKTERRPFSGAGDRGGYRGGNGGGGYRGDRDSGGSEDRGGYRRNSY